MIKFSRRLLLLALTISGLHASAQRNSFSNTPVVDATGKPVPVNTYLRVKGSPYIIDNWVPGEVVTGDGKLHNGMLLKYNVQTDLLTFVYNPKEEPLRFAEPVNSFTLFAEHKMTFANNFPKIDGHSTKSYYEVIALGKTMLLKHYRQILKESRSTEDRAITDGAYVNRASYYIFKDATMARTKLKQDDILKALGDKSSQIDAFIAKTPVDFEKEEDLKKLFDYYNTL